ncbi:MAG: DUF4325 domain-containing protein [Clostridia bacterium]|nr:DUF4325 domain-containing protein [Clostridia bacterium]
MKYTAEKKQAVRLYILEKISSGAQNLSSAVAEALGISTNTVHSYLKELLADGIIQKKARGKYELTKTASAYTFKRSLGELESDTLAYDICLRDKLRDFPQHIKHIWSYALSEMVNNVIDHSGAEVMEIGVTQSYLETSVSIIDNGIGIFQKIKSHFSFPSLDEAICELFKGKLTTDKANHSGEGIFFSSKMMDSFFIFSDGKIFTTSKYENDCILDLGESAPGTCVYMSLSNFTSRTAQEVFNLYASEEGAFTTTRIPLRSIFDSAPVSRSQAKRICNRLDAFQEVILDFEGVGWMGQGFAHQLFVVFANSHPELSLVPIHMSEDVTAMYNHVVGGG